MIIKINQTSSNGRNKFEIKVNDEVKYLAGTPWMKLSLPMDAENTRPSVMTGTDESVCLKMGYNVGENMSSKVFPIKWMFGVPQKSKIYMVYDGDDNFIGRFYYVVKGVLDSKLVIECEDYSLNCYDKGVGKTRNILVYKGETQIAEIVKPLHASKNLDSYYIFLLDEYSELESILSFFTVYFDRIYYSNAGEIVARKEEVRYERTYNVYDKYYDENWIADHFDKEEVEAIFVEAAQKREKIKKSIKKQAIITLLIFIAAWAILLSIFPLPFCR